MEKKLKTVRLFLVGAAMGVANIIPGVSGGTIAVVFGIFEDLMEALGRFISDKQNRMYYIRFLAILFSGSLISILSLARFLDWSFENFPLPTVYFFLGLIIGSIPVVYRSYPDMKPNTSRVSAFLIGFAGVVILALLQGSSSEPHTGMYALNLSIVDYLYYGLAGMIAASAMIVPGVSGSFILILLGAYWTVLNALSVLTSSLLQTGLTAEMMERIFLLGALGIGVTIGILGFSRIMSWALKKFPSITMYMILGLILGSIYQIYPGVEYSLQMIFAVVTFIIGIIISLKFGMDKKKSEKDGALA